MRERYGIRWSSAVKQWEVFARGDRKSTYHAELGEAMEEYHHRAGGKAKGDGIASKSVH